MGAGYAALGHGIVFRQLLGWHHVVGGSEGRIGPVSDGVVALIALGLVTAGVIMLVNIRGRLATPRVPRRIVGAMLLGGGGFQVIEGLLMHHLFGLHHVNPASATAAWDAAYLLSGIAVAAVGAGILSSVSREVRRLESDQPPPRSHRRRTHAR